ncbi:4-alpha-glucanotransferase [Parachlamydia sp. AcF125]|uniref:4-alpha-glucanotransferase n=1 Tax=Parachlamydia sp. AcF125 TaxID=2795736 RepID=UPI001BC9B958|nr:4-alpha-glucanotransferase [Parachlamydia sp. AcF125]MBS4169117.1 4-alpha-glucanotransferase [Parachlamydia sp. AcF125]
MANLFVQQLLRDPTSLPPHGICLPIFSLHSKGSGGIGEYTDLLPLLAWAKKLGIHIIQLLPLNDTGLETSPYNALSAFALNPIHLGLKQLPYLANYPELTPLLAQLQALNQTQRVSYKEVHGQRDLFLRQYFQLAGPLLLKADDFQKFQQQNEWVEKYALFKTLKIARNWESWDLWPEKLRYPTEDYLAELLLGKREEVAYHSLLQFLCFSQMEKVKKEAESQGIFLKGDIPILIDSQSADVWLNRPLFHTHLTAGAPPDQYSEVGQNWGFPLYNWDKHAETHYTWWKKRLEIASHFYHFYRIDHVVGFYRIWGIPFNQSAKEGKFFPEDPSVWISHGEKILKMMVDYCPMLPIGEDLGVIPPEVRINLRQLGICGTKVMRWERRWNEDGRFINPHDYILESLTTVSTHDSETLQQWWRNNPQDAKDFSSFKGWTYEPTLSSVRHQEILYDSHHTRSIFHINLLHEYLAVIPGLTWPSLEDERINIPGVVSDRNWSYRFKPSVEEIIQNPELAKLIKKLTV